MEMNKYEKMVFEFLTSEPQDLMEIKIKLHIAESVTTRALIKLEKHNLVGFIANSNQIGYYRLQG